MSKRVLITGGSGFLGRHLALSLRQVNQVVLGARNNKLNRLAEETTGCRALPLDVSSIESVRDAFAEVRPEVVIHAAATKFVDLSERSPMECIDVNVLGSQNIARVAVETGVESVLGISTDKAAPPSMNTYALSKALMERLFCTMDSKGKTGFCCVRCGNIAWSTGSVFPDWKAMQDDAGVIRTTGPEMFRFFVTVEAAVELVTVAFDHRDELGGKVITKPMKVAQIKDLLSLWTETRGGRWEVAPRRMGDSDQEDLIGDSEAEFCRQVVMDGKPYYVLTFGDRPADALKTGVSSATADRLDRAEMLSLLDATPE
jgi:FlaA1/EpsC-like NDP-sugar epimerase